MDFFENKGPFDINYIIKKCLYVENKKKISKNIVKNIGNLKNAKSGDITFYENKKYLNDLNSSLASFCFIKNRDMSDLKNKKIKPIISKNPLNDFIITSNLFYPEAAKDNFQIKISSKYNKYKKRNVYISKFSKIGKKFNVGFNSVLINVKIGDNVSIGSNCVITNSIIEDNVIINSGSIIGKIGYGFKYIEKNFYFIPHIGCVKIFKNVYIGSNCTIDRGSFNDTIIQEGTKIDNQVHLAHNVNIGKNCYLAAQVGIAGSTKIGDNCLLGGKTGIAGHLKIGNNVNIGGKSGVLKDLPDGSKVIGYPAMSIKKFLGKNK